MTRDTLPLLLFFFHQDPPARGDRQNPHCSIVCSLALWPGCCPGLRWCKVARCGVYYCWSICQISSPSLVGLFWRLWETCGRRHTARAKHGHVEARVPACVVSDTMLLCFGCVGTATDLWKYVSLKEILCDVRVALAVGNWNLMFLLSWLWLKDISWQRSRENVKHGIWWILNKLWRNRWTRTNCGWIKLVWEYYN